MRDVNEAATSQSCDGVIPLLSSGMENNLKTTSKDPLTWGLDFHNGVSCLIGKDRKTFH